MMLFVRQTKFLEFHPCIKISTDDLRDHSEDSGYSNAFPQPVLSNTAHEYKNASARAIKRRGHNSYLIF